MGNSESQNSEGGSRAGGTAPPEMRTCYYEILEVERSDTTTADDIKKVSLPSALCKAKTNLISRFRRRIVDLLSNIIQTKTTKTHKLQLRSSSRYKPLTRCFPTSRSGPGMTPIENRSSAEQTVTMLLRIGKWSELLLKIS